MLCTYLIRGIAQGSPHGYSQHIHSNNPEMLITSIAVELELIQQIELLRDIPREDPMYDGMKSTQTQQ